MITVRDSVRSDAKEIYALISNRADSFTKPAEINVGDWKSFEEMIYDGVGLHCVTALYDGVIVGYVFYFYSGSSLNCMRSITVKNLYVKDEYRRKGIGTAMLNFMKQKSIDENTMGLEWFNKTDDPTGMGFYSANGLEPEEMRYQYHWNNGNTPEKLKKK